jgi:hypothetical protein
VNILKTYLGSNELKKVIIKRVTENSIPLRHVCNHIKYNYHSFMSSYINSVNASNCEITKEQFEKMLDLLGIEPRVQFVVKSDFDAKKVKADLEDEYNKNH